MTIIGDVHGKLIPYRQMVERCSESLCVGDFGFKSEIDWHRENIHGDHWINPGNHDYIPEKNDYPYTGNWKHFPQWNLMTIRGADSIDKAYRLEGRDWFRDEEMSYAEGITVMDIALDLKPDIIVSHDCPQYIMEQLFGYEERSFTRQLLQSIFNNHQPKFWIFGHHHKSRSIEISGTRFICLSELETFEI